MLRSGHEHLKPMRSTIRKHGMARYRAASASPISAARLRGPCPQMGASNWQLTLHAMFTTMTHFRKAVAWQASRVAGAGQLQPRGWSENRPRRACRPHGGANLGRGLALAGAGRPLTPSRFAIKRKKGSNAGQQGEGDNGQHRQRHADI